jgi:diadenosine tetraphosphatase ApaH/serine/threonine PP2A family protein phosphatase
MKAQLGYWRWKVYRWNEHANPFRDRYELALEWLRQHQNDRAFLEELRATLIRCGLVYLPLDDSRRILEEVARRLSTGELHLCGEFFDPFYSPGAVPAPAEEQPIPARAAPVAPPPAAPPPAPAPAPAPAQQTTASTSPAAVSSTTDAAATAQALKDAAQSGIPFCEECEKAKQAAKKAAPPPAVPEEVDAGVSQNTDAAATAQALQNAASTGTPFCAECEKARQALQQAAASGAANGTAAS